MKTLKFLSLFLLTWMCLSCENSEIETLGHKGIGNSKYVSTEGTLLDGGSISGINLYCLEKNAVQDYNAFQMRLIVNRDAPQYTSDDISVMHSIGRIEKEYNKEKCTFILDDYNEYKKNTPGFTKGWPELFTACTNDEVTITCDKMLYGKKPGTNLNSFFSIIPYGCDCMPVGLEKAKLLYRFTDELPTVMSEFFVVGSWLSIGYNLMFASEPSEKYDELTFYLSLPVTKEHVWDYAVAKYHGKELASMYSEAVYKAECKIKFAWNQ